MLGYLAVSPVLLRLIRAVAKPLHAEYDKPPCPECEKPISHILPSLTPPMGHLPDSERDYFYCQSCHWHGSP